MTSSFLLLAAAIVTFVIGWSVRQKMRFLGISLLAFNKDLASPFSWRTILLVVSVVGLVGTYYLRTMFTLGPSLLGLIGWWGAQANQWRLLLGREIRASAVFAGLALIALLFYGLGRLHEKEEKFKRFALVFLIIGITGITGMLFFLSTKPGLEFLEEITRGDFFFRSWQITFSLFVFVISIVGVTLYSVSKKLVSLPELIAVFILTTLFGLIALLPEQEMFARAVSKYGFYFGNELTSSGVLWALVLNLAVFFELFGLILFGYLRKEEWLINLGAFSLSLLVMVKYFDWFFTFLDKSIFFVGAGVLLLFVGWFMEKGRHYLLDEVRPKLQR